MADCTCKEDRRCKNLSLIIITYDEYQLQVDLHFPVAWNELAQAMGTAAVYEFQAWARATTYAKVSGSYIISCQGEVLIVRVFVCKSLV